MTNIQQLILWRVSYEAVPAGGGLADGIAWILDAEVRKRTFADAKVWVEGAIRVMKAEFLDMSDQTDEFVAGRLLVHIQLKRDKQGPYKDKPPLET